MNTSIQILLKQGLFSLIHLLLKVFWSRSICCQLFVIEPLVFVVNYLMPTQHHNSIRATLHTRTQTDPTEVNLTD